MIHGVKLPISHDIRQSARGEDCALRLLGCEHVGSTVYAHLRMYGFGGTGIKPPEPLGVYSCGTCHDALDRRTGDRLWTEGDVLRALMHTLVRLRVTGHLFTKEDLR